GGPVTSMLRAGIVAPIACAMGGNLAGAYLASEAIGRDRERRRAHVGVAGEQQNPEGVLACGGQIDEGARKPGVYRGERKAVPCRACGATNAPGNASCIRCGAVLEWRDG
ncbi:MAG: hypothetical protein OEV43_09900, partial [Coriobacteriia bacterium]|nr:hypothetical protein [Coriobacteriia bacterium]